MPLNRLALIIKGPNEKELLLWEKMKNCVLIR